jgi:octaprenyl-diphosphate synthase
MNLGWTGKLKDNLAEIYAPIRGELEHVEQLLRVYLLNGQPYLQRLMEHGLQLGGKRLRPAVLLLAGRACGSLREEHYLMGAVMELIHTATLVHDDVLDGAKRRRHLETINVRWDTETSVIFGDYLFTIAIELTTQLGDREVSARISRAGRRLCEGELRQIAERGNFALKEQEYLEIIEAKTAELYSCAAELGAYFAGAPHGIRESLARYGREIGIAFQIIDDVLDVAGSEEIAGKSLGTDLQKQKPTLPVIRLLQIVPAEERAGLLQQLKNPSPENLSRLREQLVRSGAVDYARSKAMEFVNSAVHHLQGLERNEGTIGLQAVASYVVGRQR